jgi:3-dehydroquinate dehydratase-1
MAERYADRPVVTMSMSPLGAVSRLVGEAFGSALTFGSAGPSSAPGQLPANELQTALDILHAALTE